METLAYIHTAIAYEDPNPEAILRDFDGTLSNAFLAGTLAVGVVVTTVASPENAQALIRYGDTGPGVGQLQEQLGIRADQVYGQQTQKAVKQFQTRNGLLADGIAGRETLAALGLPPNLGPGHSNSTKPVSGNVVVAVRALNVRSYGSLAAPVKSVLYSGDRVSLTGASRNADGYNWVQLASGGWVAESFLNYGSGGEQPVSGSAYVNVWNGLNGLNVRNDPAGSIIGSLKDGQAVALTGEREYAAGRYWVQLSNRGWVAEDFLRYY